eukprot:TRINITY_DN28993_c0_g1_i1.p1 TRINITY_DN28993_c0_g1~~TRINITY_DN28993_c0_g1_i1.p1  ORF type:complete len:109 (+),score=29.91 TRINITY_DN28993_c0_g1_i1:39-329(+)
MTEGQVVQRAPAQLNIWAIGQGFEGTASDWTEYVVWLVGFISLIWFLYQRNVSPFPGFEPLPEEALQPEEASDTDEAAEDVSSKKKNKKNIKKKTS